MIKEKFEFRVVWKRRGASRRVFRCATEKSVARRVSLLMGKPWEAYGAAQGDVCTHHQCDVRGMTWAEWADGQNATFAPLEYLRIERRPVAPWSVGVVIAIEPPPAEKAPEELDEVPW